MLVDPAFLLDKNHAKKTCVQCHKGDPKAAARKDAHVGLVSDPSWGTTNSCGDAGCHDALAKTFETSLHATLAGEKQSLIARSGGTALTGKLETAFNNHCGRCHSSCGDCHISVPTAAGGGLLAGHKIKKTPPMSLVCTACHGSRVSDEYKGDNPGIKGDVHYSKGMQCVSCHKADEMHGVGQASVTHRYQVTNAPRSRPAIRTTRSSRPRRPTRCTVRPTARSSWPARSVTRRLTRTAPRVTSRWTMARRSTR